jgi:hypothetical protein
MKSRRFRSGSNYEPMSAYKPATAEKFLRDLLGTFIDPVCRQQREGENGWVDGTGDYSASLYPFNKPAFFCNNATNDPRSAKPSEILNALNNAAYEAMVANSLLITPQILEKLKMS